MKLEYGYRALGAIIVASLAALPACAGSPAPAKRAETPSARATRPVESHRYDVIIVGAGMAGLTAGKTLKHAGRNVLLLEATDRIGGRGITDTTTFSAPIDLGGAWIHGVETNPLSPIILGTGLAVQPTEVDASKHFFLNHRFATRCERERFDRISEAFEAALEDSVHPSGPSEVAADDAASNYLPKSEPAGSDSNTDCKATPKPAKKGNGKRAQPAEPPVVEATFNELLSLVALNTGPLESATELEKNSNVDATEFLAGNDVLIKKGYGTFVEEYGKEMLPDVHLSSPVTRIRRGPNGVVVETSKGERFEARKVLVTVSTGVLRAGKIKFDPELPKDKLEALDGLPMGVLDKVIMEFKTPDVFPKDNGASLANTWVLYGGDTKNPDDDMAFVFSPMRSNIAIGFIGGERAWKLEKLPNHGRDAMIKLATDAMNDMCKCDVTASLVAARTTSWGTENWTYGAYSAAAPGKSAMRQKLAEPVENVLYFAGEACDFSTYNGSFAAAYNSALRASHGLLACLGREDKGESCGER
ncbi:FAD-dependent oxidoreductase [Pendulispora brunnea]|uniref:Tryptophan 2-monooxygenase n=1 Tax=Pendulispora brunnea TaxID=2905690 RepID=A0ABZ2JVH2_9BACT